MTDTAELSTPRGVKRFSWTAVNPRTARKLLESAYRATGQEDDLAELRRLSNEDLARHAERVFGSRPKDKPTKVYNADVFDVLIADWLPSADIAQLRLLAGTVKQGLAAEARSAPTTTKQECLDFLNERNRTLNFRANVWRSFTAAPAHKVLTEPGPGPRKGPPDVGSVWDLTGRGERMILKPYQHQRDAWQALDDLAASMGHRSGRIIIPTGGGKTATMVIWLLRHMQTRPGLRVLWIADQQELVDQAARAFARHAAAEPKGFHKILRTVHSQAGRVTALTDDEADVVCATRQSILAGGLELVGRGRLGKFLARETVVVIDEAHHAVAPTYQTLIDFLWTTENLIMLIGLTATPWPAGAGQTAQLHKTFERPLLEASAAKLVEAGHLARPVLHTVSTGQRLTVTDEEIRRLAGREVPPRIAAELNRHSRNWLAVSHWQEHKETWGKTLVFACNIRHADALGDGFRKASVTVDVVHHAADVDLARAVRDFREAKDPRVLVSVGMLLEGVDLPAARTAFLLRPTGSPIVLRQMIGRVLRGVPAGGDAQAHLVDFVDQWSQDAGILSPVDIPDVPIRIRECDDGDDDEHRLPPVIATDGTTEIGPDLLRSLQRALAERVRVSGLDATLTSTHLVGFYDLSTVRIPVYEHTQAEWKDLAQWALDPSNKKGKPASAIFDGLQPPTPLPVEITPFVDYCRSYEAIPPFESLDARVDIADVARRLIDAESMTETERLAWLRREYEGSLARSIYPSLQLFIEAIDQEKLTLLKVIGPGPTPERIGPRRKIPAENLRHSEKRASALSELFAATIREGTDLLLGEPDYQQLLHKNLLPDIDWTRRDNTSTWAYWSWRTSGKAKGGPVIRVNRILQAPKTQVSDQLLQYLLWHETCHHLTPGQGHDAEFRRLERLWPNHGDLTDELDTLHERYALPGALKL